jgi:hypothetical protein
VLFGIEGLYSPLALALVAFILVVSVRVIVSWVLSTPRRLVAGTALSAVFALIGLLLVARAAIGVFNLNVYNTELVGTTPIALATGPVLIAYSASIVSRVWLERAPVSFREWYATPASMRLRKILQVAVGGLAVAAVFWATNRFAFALGQTRSYAEAVDPSTSYVVTIDTKEPLSDLPKGVVERPLLGSGDEGREYRYRYEGLRLLLESGGKLFVVPAEWTRSSRTLVFPYDPQQARLQLFPPPASLER